MPHQEGGIVGGQKQHEYVQANPNENPSDRVGGPVLNDEQAHGRKSQQTHEGN